MRIVVIGGAGLIGSRLITTLRLNGHDAVAAPPRTCPGANTGNGMAAVLRRARVVVDLSDPPCVHDEEGVERFGKATRTVLEAGLDAGVTHHVAFAPVGAELGSDYFRAQLAKEQLIRRSAAPYSIVRATPLFESLETIADFMTQGSTVRVPPVLAQPVAAEDVVQLLAAVAVDAPLKRTVEIGGPEPFYLGGLIQRVLGARNDPRKVIADANARYFGARLDERSLVAGDEAELGAIRFDDWLRDTAPGPRRADVAVHGGSTSHPEHEFRVADVPPGSVLLMGDVAVFSVAGGFCATQAMCTHRAGPLSEGSVDDSTVTCPLHGARFNIWTGAVLRGPAKTPLETYRVIVEGDVGRVVVDDRATVLASSAV